MPPKVLVVDDEADLELLFRQRFRKAIRADELEFAFAHNGLEALSALQVNGEVSVVLTDIRMPVMDGLTFLAELEQLGCATQAVVISAYSDMENIRTAMNRGAFDFLTKPLDFQDVEVTIRKTIAFVERLRESRRAEEYRIARDTAEKNYRQLKELEALRDSLTHMIVHDMRTPLTSLLTGLYTLELLGDLNDGQRDLWQNAVSGGESLLAMINDLLDISKMESGTLSLEVAEVAVSGILEQVVRQVDPLVRDKGLTLETSAAPDLPLLPADQDKLRRTLVNLLGNAIKFTPRGGSVRVRACRCPEEAGVLFSVVDTGEGIPRNAFEKIFEKFGQVETRKGGRLRSTGLGLTFCKMAVEAHGGRIWVESELGRGSTFTFVIPGRQGVR